MLQCNMGRLYFVNTLVLVYTINLGIAVDLLNKSL